ncbi:MAG: hypothetical protein E6J90_47495 [Deltaproteobacteria bacterium]|nr:MAG: hypothetical protein E6J90_47495 [Deltaproteobacteria bacterium]TMQ13734.1 MAG: hypothetical protein E6J91_17445 [Deltaproteobacteria bacterium]
MKNKRSHKRLQIATETLRTLASDDVRNVVGGAVQDDGGRPGGAVGFTDSISISWGGNNCCNCK